MFICGKVYFFYAYVMDQWISWLWLQIKRNVESGDKLGKVGIKRCDRASGRREKKF